jgi:hypothetical protein
VKFLDRAETAAWFPCAGKLLPSIRYAEPCKGCLPWAAAPAAKACRAFCHPRDGLTLGVACGPTSSLAEDGNGPCVAELLGGSFQVAGLPLMSPPLISFNSLIKRIACFMQATWPAIEGPRHPDPSPNMSYCHILYFISLHRHMRRKKQGITAEHGRIRLQGNAKSCILACRRLPCAPRNCSSDATISKVGPGSTASHRVPRSPPDIPANCRTRSRFAFSSGPGPFSML